MKLAPRLFAMMTFEMRVYFCVTEQNISRLIFKYFPQQTMTLDKADLTKQLLMLVESYIYICPLIFSLVRETMMAGYGPLCDQIPVTI